MSFQIAHVSSPFKAEKQLPGYFHGNITPCLCPARCPSLDCSQLQFLWHVGRCIHGVVRSYCRFFPCVLNSCVRVPGTSPMLEAELPYLSSKGTEKGTQRQGPCLC